MQLAVETTLVSAWGSAGQPRRHQRLLPGPLCVLPAVPRSKHTPKSCVWRAAAPWSLELNWQGARARKQRSLYRSAAVLVRPHPCPRRNRGGTPSRVRWAQGGTTPSPGGSGITTTSWKGKAGLSPPKLAEAHTCRRITSGRELSVAQPRSGRRLANSAGALGSLRNVVERRTVVEKAKTGN